MIGTPGERLYDLLPEVYRVRDAAQGEPLRALLGVIESELEVLEADIEQLYDNWFVETCAEWVVPYLGELLGVRGLLPAQNGAFSQRGLVANTLAYRRGKGTAAVLEQLARDVTGWPARVVEFFELLAATQYLNHVRPGKGGTLNLRDANALELLNGPFERAAHTVDVRRISEGRGRYNIPNVGIFLWRLQSYSINRGAARAVHAVSALPDGRYAFNPLGFSAPLFNRPLTETDITQLAAEENVPGFLRRRLLHDELETRRQAQVDGLTPPSLYFGHQPVLRVFIQKSGDPEVQEIPSDEIVICNLQDDTSGDWQRPPDKKKYLRSSDGKEFERQIQVGVDPMLGRLAFRKNFTDFAKSRVELSYAYGFSGDLGGGPYDRRASVSRWLDPLRRRVTWQRGVTQNREVLRNASDPTQLTDSLAKAIEAWNQHVASSPQGESAPFGLIALMDNSTYPDSLPTIEIPAGTKLAIVAADWPEVETPDASGRKKRELGEIAPDNSRPHIWGDVSVHGTAGNDISEASELVLDGLLVEGKLTVSTGALGSLRLAHSTLVPGKGGLEIGSQNDRLGVSLDRSICGPMVLPDSVPRLNLVDCIVGRGGDGSAIIAPGAAVEVETSTVLGNTNVSRVAASNSIFTRNVMVSRRQSGCVRFCYLPLDSLVPRRYRCQPDDTGSSGRVVPQFTSVTYGQPGYGQLTPTCPAEISAGADDEGEMGAFHFLQQVQRVKNVRTSLDEYLRFGLEAGIVFVS
jgi:hypothetical protein